MIVSSPVRARAAPPLTGASCTATPRGASASSSRCAVDGRIVLCTSTLRVDSRSSRTSDSTAGSSGTARHTTSQSPRWSTSEAPSPPSARRRSTRSAEVSRPTTSNPDRRSCTAIGMPMSPSPRNATRTTSPPGPVRLVDLDGLVVRDLDGVVEGPAELFVHLPAAALVVDGLLAGVLGDLLDALLGNDDDAVAIAHDEVARVDPHAADRDRSVVLLVLDSALGHALVDELSEDRHLLDAALVRVADAAGGHDALRPAQVEVQGVP